MTSLFSNPLTNPLFLPTAGRVLGLLVLALAIVVVVERRRIWPLSENAMLKKMFSWSLIGPLFLLAVLSGPAVTAVLVMALTTQGLWEYGRLVQLPSLYLRVLLGLGLLAAPLALFSAGGFFLLAPLLLIFSTLQPLVYGTVQSGVRQLAFAVLGWAYISWLLGHLVLIQRHFPGGDGIVLALAVSVALSDIGAFTFGKLFGRRPLSPRLSPNKTVEGVVGNFFGAFAGAAIMAFAVPAEILGTFFLVMPVLIGGGALWGDLVESAIKREFEVKDAGHWLPGFGGLLDRIDSLIIVSPLGYYFLRFLW
jgi:phosphatidate cytidylyltransferase